jgi:hypothetical protein
VKKSIKQIFIGLVILYTTLSIIFYGIIPQFIPYSTPCDVDYISEGDYAGCYLVSPVWGYVVIVDINNNVMWRNHREEFFIHDSDLLPNGNIIIADTSHNRVLEVDINDPSKVLWSWDALNLSDINWTQFSFEQRWTDLSFLENQDSMIVSWTHINDVDFINGSIFGRDYDSILISLCNLDLVIEVNYSKTKEIVWLYGQPGNKSILDHQHNPDRYENGNTIICDTRNNRIIEVNTTTKEVVWELKLKFPHGELRIARDCDDIGNGLRLITDSGNNRLLVYDMMSQSIIKEIKSPWFANPYDADMLDNGNILVSNLLTDTIVFVDYETGIVVRMIGFPYKWVVPYCLIITAIGYHSVKLLAALKSSQKRRLKKVLDFNVYRRVLYIGFGILSLYYFGAIITFFWFFSIQG